MSEEVKTNDYVTIVELTSVDSAGKKSTRTVNLFSSTRAGALMNELQLETLYKAKGAVDIKLLGTYSRANLVVVDKNKTGDINE